MKYLPLIFLVFLFSCDSTQSDDSDKDNNHFEYADDMSNGKGLEVSGEILAVANPTFGIYFFDIKKQNKPKELSSFQLKGATKVRISNNFAYVLSGSSASDNKLTIINISNITSPSLSSEISFDNSGNEVLVEGNNLYIAAGKSGLLVYDISNKSQPQLVSTYKEQNPLFEISDLKKDNDLLFIADFYNGVKVLNLSNVSNPVKIAEYITTQQNNCHEIELYQGKVIMQDFWDKNYDILELANNKLDSVGTIDFQRDYDTSPTELLVSGNSLFASAWWQHALEYDLSDIKNVSVKNEWTLPDHQRSIAVSSDYIYVLNQHGIEILSRD